MTTPPQQPENSAKKPTAALADGAEDMLQSLPPEEIAGILNNAPEMDVEEVFHHLDEEKAADTFEYLDFDLQYRLLNTFPKEKAAQLLNRLSPDDRTYFFEELPEEDVDEWLNLLQEDERKVTDNLLSYPEDSVGRIMTPNFIEIKPNWTVEQVLAHIRDVGPESETLNFLFVTDEEGKLLDDVKIAEILFSPPNQIVADLMDEHALSLNVLDDQEEAIRLYRVTNRNALPVTDAEGTMLGIVSIDDLVDVIEEEDTEDIQKFGGTEALDEHYLRIPLPKMIQKRVGWLIILFIGEMFTATAMGAFEEEIAKAVVLALFVPLIISSGGNSGSQSATLIIRAMALGEVQMRDWFTVMKRELVSGSVLGLTLGVIGFLRVAVWNQFSNFYGEHWMFIGLTIGITLVGIVLWGTLVGSLLPLLMKRLGFDPAASSAPFVATLVDVTGIVMYFTVAFMLLQGRLL